mgnify:FL=1
MKKYLLLSFILLILNINIFAQNNISLIKGKVTDENDLALPYVSVAVYQDNKIITGTITNDDGVFTLKVQRSDKEICLTFDFVGYVKEEMRLIPDKATFDIGDIILKENVVMLDDVVVSSTAVSHKSTVEHTTINASANMASSKGSALDILSTSSSVSIQNEEISIRGNKNILVLMDGIPTTITDLSTIPAANIKSIDVITNPDASYDSEGTGGIINIIMKKENAKGFSGAAAANYGFNHFVTGNAAFSYNGKKTSYRFNYNTKYEDDVINSSLYRFMKESGNIIKQQMISDRYTFNNNVSLGADFRINKKNTLTLDFRYMSPKLNVKQNLHNIIEISDVVEEENRHNDVTWNRDNIEAVIMFRHIIKPDVSDISFRGSVSKIWGRRPSYYHVGDILQNYSNSGGSPFITNFQADYKQKLDKGSLSAGLKITYRSNDIYHDFYSWENGEWIYSQSFSNDLLHTEMIPAAYIMFSSKNIGKFSFKAGLRGEYSIVTLDSRHENIKSEDDDIFVAPSLSGTYKLSDKQDLSLAFSRRIGRPTYPQLNPYMSMIDAMTYEQGNMYLHPEKTSKLDLTYNIKGERFNIFADAYLNYTTDYISQITKVVDGLLLTTYINSAYDIKSGFDVSIKVFPSKWMTATLSSNTFYVKTCGQLKENDYDFNIIDIDNEGWSNSSNIMLDFIPRKTTSLQVQYFIMTPQYYPQLTTSFTHKMNVGVKQKLLKGALTLSMLVTDIFDTYKWEVHSFNRLYDLTNTSKQKSRMLWLGISYNFNSYKQNKAEKSGDSERNLIKFGL